jgi:tRNA-specific 2-thiouridylase
MPNRALVCLSGGVDSTVAALLLQEQGYAVEGITFWLWSFPGAPDYAVKTAHHMLEDVATAASELGIPHYTIDASSKFYEIVIHDFRDRYRRGQTPNPCGRCNRYLRFGLALDHADKEGFDLVATGHHAKIKNEEGVWQLLRGADPKKDQSYFLYGLRKEDLPRLYFPVGNMTKAEVLSIARSHRLHAAELPQSQDLCFAKGGRPDFLFRKEEVRPGPIFDMDGNRIGQHNGLPRYTIGQRRGLNITATRPLYVVAIDAKKNALIVGEEEKLYAYRLNANEANFLSETIPREGAQITAKIRYRSPAAQCTFHPISQGRFSIRFAKRQRAISPGQIVALYDGERLLGGGIIESEIGG